VVVDGRIIGLDGKGARGRLTDRNVERHRLGIDQYSGPSIRLTPRNSAPIESGIPKAETAEFQAFGEDRFEVRSERSDARVQDNRRPRGATRAPPSSRERDFIALLGRHPSPTSFVTLRSTSLVHEVLLRRLGTSATHMTGPI